MNKVTSKNVENVISALNGYLQHITRTGQFNLQEFGSFVEPKFIENGYRPPPDFSGRGNVLIILDAMGVGDFIWKTSVIREIRQIYSASKITLVVFPAAASLAEICPYVDEVVYNHCAFPSTDFFAMYRWNVEIAKYFLMERFDVCFGLNYYWQTPFLMYMSGAKERISYKFDDESAAFPDLTAAPEAAYYAVPRRALNGLATVSAPQFVYGTHNVDIGLAPLDYLTRMPVANRAMEIWYTPHDMSVAKILMINRGDKVYALAMGGNGIFKHYPPEKYARVIEMISHEEPEVKFVLFGGGDTDLHSAQILKNTIPEIYDKKVINLIGRTTYRQTAAAMTFCNMCIGNDTSTMHVAAAVKVPALAVFAFPADAPSRRVDATKVCCPYGVPNVVVQPEHALPECSMNYNYIGCKVRNMPHCITQIAPEKIFEGFHILKQRIAENNIVTLYIH